MRFVKYARLLHHSSANKFWQMDAKGDTMIITETNGFKVKQVTKTFSTFEKCLEEAQRLIDKKLKSGYQEGSFPSTNLDSREIEAWEYQESIKKSLQEKRK